MDAQYTLNVYAVVLDVLAEYLRENGGRWPKSWDDLVVIHHPGNPPFRWPEDLGEIRKRVRINFDVTTAEVIAAGVEHFTAVTQREPNYSPFEYHIIPFLEAARRSVGHIQGPAVPNTLTAYALVLDVLAEYLRENGGRWPKSWDDLVVIRDPGYPPLRWPEDIGKIRKEVGINFDVTTADVIASGAEHFTAVAKREPNYGPYKLFIFSFIETVRGSVGQIQESAVPKRSPR
jgi:hypothetical protein